MAFGLLLLHQVPIGGRVFGDLSSGDKFRGQEGCIGSFCRFGNQIPSTQLGFVLMISQFHSRALELGGMFSSNPDLIRGSRGGI